MSLKNYKLVKILLLLALLGGFIFGLYPRIINIKFWWALLQPQISRAAGGGLLECKVIKWCGFAKICGHFCENKEKTFMVENFSIAPISGTVHAKEWALIHLAKRQNKGFPEIPLPITKVILEKGDLSLVAEGLPPLDYIELRRNSFIGSDWLIQAHSGQTIKVAGRVGDVINLKVKLLKFSYQIKNLAKTSLDGQIEILSSHFGYAPVKLKLINLHLQKNLYKNFKLPNLVLSAEIKLNPQFKQIISINKLNLTEEISGQSQKRQPSIHLHSKPFSDELELEPMPADFIDNYLPNYKLKGVLQGTLKPNYQNPKLSKANLWFSSLFISHGQVSALGPLNGQIVLEKQKIAKFSLQAVKPINLISLQNVLKPHQISLNKGFLTGNLIYDGVLKGNFKVYALQGLFEKFSFEAGSGEFKINNNNLTGLFQAFIEGKQNLIKSKINLKLQNTNLNKPLIGGIIELKADLLNLPSSPDLKEGQIQALSALIKINNNQISALTGQTTIKKLVVLANKQIIKITQGNLKLAENKTVLIQNLKAELTASDWASINGFIKFKDYTFKKIINNDLSIQAFGSAVSLFPLIPELSKINKPAGKLSLEAHLQNNKFTQLKMLVVDLGGEFRKHKFSNGNGLIKLLESNKLSFENFKFDYGNSSKLALNGFVILNSANEEILSLLSSFDGSLEGIIYLKDLLSGNLQAKHKISFSEQTHFPFTLKLKPALGKNIVFDFDSHFNSLGSIGSPWLALSDDLPGYLIASGNLNLQNQYFNLQRLETSLTGLNISGKAEGFLNNFSFKAYTDPLINLDKIFKQIKGISLKGSINGWIEGKEINVFQPKSLWKNLRLSVKTDEGESVTIGSLELTSLENYFESKDNKGLATIIAEKGQFKNLVFSEINSSLILENNQLKMPGLSLSAAGGTITINGNLNLSTNNGSFNGKAQKINVGQLARGLAGLRGFSGIGDLTFATDGHILSLVKSEKPVSASGSFNLHNGNAAQVITLQKKLNLANLVFGGPLALNMNGLLGVLAPESNGYYTSLSGSWKLNDNNITFPEIRYRGKNKLNLNMAGFLNRNNSQLKMNIIGSIPRTPVRVDSAGHPSELLNIVSQFNFTNVLGRFPLLDRVFDARPRVFRFTMKGNLNNQTELNASASNSFSFLDSKLHKNLPVPALPPPTLR